MSTVALGLSWAGGPLAVLDAVVEHVDVVEIVPDHIVGLDGTASAARRRELDRLLAHRDVTYHGLGLSLGWTDWSTDKSLADLETLLAWRRPLWHSRRLASSPRVTPSVETLDRVIDRVRELQDRHGIELMLQHPTPPPGRPGDMTPATFVNTVASETGSRMLLDLPGLLGDADDGLLDLEMFLDELDWSAVGEVHTSGGSSRSGDGRDVVRCDPADDREARLLQTAVRQAERLALVVQTGLPAREALTTIRRTVDGAVRERRQTASSASRC